MSEYIFTVVTNDDDVKILRESLKHCDESYKKYDFVCFVKTPDLGVKCNDLLSLNGFKSSFATWSDILCCYKTRMKIDNNGVLDEYLGSALLLSPWYMMELYGVDKALKIEPDVVMWKDADRVFNSNVQLHHNYTMGAGTLSLYDNSQKMIDILTNLYKLFDETLDWKTYHRYHLNALAGSPILFVKKHFDSNRYEKALYNLHNSQYFLSLVRQATRWHANNLDEKFLTMALCDNLSIDSKYLVSLCIKPWKLTDGSVRSALNKSLIHMAIRDKKALYDRVFGGDHFVDT